MLSTFAFTVGDAHRSKTNALNSLSEGLVGPTFDTRGGFGERCRPLGPATGRKDLSGHSSCLAIGKWALLQPSEPFTRLMPAQQQRQLGH